MDLRQSDKQNYPPDNPYEDPENYSGFVIIQLSEEYIDVESKTLPEMAERSGLEELLAVKEIHEFPSRRLIVSRDPMVLYKEEERAKELDDFPLPFASIQSWRLDLRQAPEMVIEVIEKLRSTHGVAWVYPELRANDPDANIAPTDPEFAQQGYLQAAHLGGIDAIFAWRHPHGTGTGVRIADIEQGWDLNNVEFLTKVPILKYGDNSTAESQHGTAVLGILIADDNAFGGIGVAPMKGISPAMESVYVFSHYQSSDDSNGSRGHVADAIEAALPLLNPGDILLIEVERGGYPTESDINDWRTIRKATNQGIIVIEAAGNEGESLDSEGALWENYVQLDIEPFNRNDAKFTNNWDSGAILVGAADWDSANGTHRRSIYNPGGSNYGARIDCFGWGNNVVTIDITNPPAGTFPFSGTSAAAPIIAGAATLLQGIYRHLHSGQNLSPQDMRDILTRQEYSTPQDPNEAATKPIGVMPNLRAILENDSRFQA